ncbi:MAG: DNA polymerase III subunit delta [Ignavibacteriaceae bacterium]
MAKKKVNIPSILEVNKELKKGIILPVYYLSGEDSYSINAVSGNIQKKAASFITSDFDKETVYGENKNFVDVISAAQAFPFGSEKKLIVFKQADKPKDKKELIRYAESPADFTVLICIHEGTISNPESEPYNTLLKEGFLFEAKELKGKHLADWLISEVESKGKKITSENAELMLDMVGDSKQLLELQLDKLFLFIGDNNEITLDIISSLSTKLKEYSIFDLQNAIGKRNKELALKYAYNLLEKGNDLVMIVAMLTKYFTGLARVSELITTNVNEYQAAKIVGTHPYYYKDYIEARRRYSNKDIVEAFRALLKADLSNKTTQTEAKTIVAVLIAELIT